ncbi:hypothetical protein AcW1_003150 [Taiwanofungus camphoratus]|nr:hypothetical protein AcW1_003150 [Antrodia cinnamomea]
MLQLVLLSSLFVSMSVLTGSFALLPDTTVTLSYGSFQGVAEGNISSFLGMPFAQPPLGNLRFAPPQEPQPFHGVRQAVEYGAACPQQAQTIPAGLPFNLSASRPPPNVSEDCLFVNVIKPASTTIGDKLPVLFVGRTSQKAE